jgi:polar amino acid transport system substrate-binding protein
LKKTLNAIFTLGTFLLAGQTSLAQELPPLRWAADAEGGAPYIFKDPKNLTRNIGFEVDLAQALEKELGRKIEFTQSDYKNLINHLKLGDRDFVMNGWEVTPDRQKDVLFTRPYYAFTLQLVVRDDEKRFETLLGCREVKGTVGTLEDTAASRLLEKWRVKHRIYDGQVEPYDDLEQKVLDAVLLDLPIALYYAQESMVTPARPLRFTDKIIGRGHYAIAVSKNNPALRDELDAALGRVIEKGELVRILFKWKLWDPQQAELLPSGVFYDEALLKGERTIEDTEEESFITLLLDGALETVKLTIYSFALAVALGLIIATSRLYGPLPVRFLATVYVEFFRGIPVLLLLAFLYFGLPAIAKSFGWDEYSFSLLGWEYSFNLKMNAEVAAILGLGLNYAAYEAEIYRAGISAIPRGQWEAASSLGMGGFLTFRRIILPQAFRIILPPMTNDLVALFKDTSVVSVIAVVELSKQYQILTKSSSENLVTIALATAALYLIMSVPLGFLSRYLEKRWGAAAL